MASTNHKFDSRAAHRAHLATRAAPPRRDLAHAQVVELEPLELGDLAAARAGQQARDAPGRHLERAFGQRLGREVAAGLVLEPRRPAPEPAPAPEVLGRVVLSSATQSSDGPGAYLA